VLSAITPQVANPPAAHFLRHLQLLHLFQLFHFAPVAPSCVLLWGWGDQKEACHRF
jgi:hypothetical protein